MRLLYLNTTLAAAPAPMLGTATGLFDTLTRLITDAQLVLIVFIGFLGVLAAIVIMTVKRFTISSILTGLVVGGLIVWAGVGGIEWASEQIGTELEQPAATVASGPTNTSGRL